MSFDTAEIAVEPTTPATGVAGARRAAVAQGAVHAQPARAQRSPVVRRWARLPQLSELCALDQARMVAVRDSWRALWVSRLLVLLAGAGTVATLGFGPTRGAFDPPGITRGFGWLGNVLAAPVARWDSAWYLVIAHYGYRPELGVYTSARDAFFPLYPLGLRLLSDVGLQPVLAGVAFSLAAFAFALYGIHRLTTLELGARGRADAEQVARLAVLVTALAPMAFFFSAVYSESLYLALSVGLFLCARQGRWLWVGLLGALAAATRSTGVLLLAPALMLYLYGPRDDSAPVRGFSAIGAGTARYGSNGGGPRRRPTSRGLVELLTPRYHVRADVLWLALVPAGLGAYMAYLGLAGGDPLAPFHAQDVWGRHFAGPYVAVWDGIKAAFAGARQLLSAQTAYRYFPIAAGSPFIAAGHNLMLLVFLLAAVPLVVLALRTLPLAYGAYVLLALALPLSYPVTPQPLMSLPRFLVVLFPLGIAFAAWLAARPRLRTPVLVASALLMAFFTAQFATWHWVA